MHVSKTLALTFKYTTLVEAIRGFTLHMTIRGEQRLPISITTRPMRVITPLHLLDKVELIFSGWSVVGVELLLKRKGHLRNQLNPAHPMFNRFWLIVRGDFSLLRRLKG